jgi:hypothetical protein
MQQGESAIGDLKKNLEKESLAPLITGSGRKRKMN